MDQQIILGQRKFKVREKKILVNIFLKTNYFGKIVESEGLFVSKKIWFQYFFVKQNTWGQVDFLVQFSCGKHVPVHIILISKKVKFQNQDKF